MPKSKLLRVCSSLLVLGALSLVMPACASNSGDEAAKDKDKEAQKNPEPEAAPVEAEGRPVEGEQNTAEAPAPKGGANDQYTLNIDTGEGKVGEEGKVTISIVPKETWHMNLEYPTKLSVTPPEGVEVAKATMKKDDAVKLVEEHCEFAVAYTPSEAGEKTFTGEFKFAVCQDTACVPKTETLEFKVAVK